MDLYLWQLPMLLSILNLLLGGEMMNFKFRKTTEELRRILDLRKSSATTPTKNKKKYNRKRKHPNQPLD